MIKKILVIAIVSGLSSCVEYPTSNYTKPFVIIGKTPSGSYGAQYTYQDANGAQLSFTDYIERYEVGDTLN